MFNNVQVAVEAMGTNLLHRWVSLDIIGSIVVKSHEHLHDSAFWLCMCVFEHLANDHLQLDGKKNHFSIIMNIIIPKPIMWVQVMVPIK